MPFPPVQGRRVLVAPCGLLRLRSHFNLSRKKLQGHSRQKPVKTVVSTRPGLVDFLTIVFDYWTFRKQSLIFTKYLPAVKGQIAVIWPSTAGTCAWLNGIAPGGASIISKNGRLRILPKFIVEYFPLPVVFGIFNPLHGNGI